MTDNNYAREGIASGRSRSENQNLFSLFEARVLDPDKTLIEEPGRRTHSYADIVALSGRLANTLVALGVRPGDRVAAQTEKSVSAWRSIWRPSGRERCIFR